MKAEHVNVCYVFDIWLSSIKQECNQTEKALHVNENKGNSGVIYQYNYSRYGQANIIKEDPWNNLSVCTLQDYVIQ